MFVVDSCFSKQSLYNPLTGARPLHASVFASPNALQLS